MGITSMGEKKKKKKNLDKLSFRGVHFFVFQAQLMFHAFEQKANIVAHKPRLPV